MGAKPRKRVEQKRLPANHAVDLEWRLARALNHPLRVEILSLVNHEAMAVVELSERLELPLSNISYHVRVLHELKCIEPVREEQVRGAIKTTYRACTRTLLEGVRWTTLSPAAKSGLAEFGVGVLIDRAREAIAADISDPEPECPHRPLTPALDQGGWVEVAKILAGAVGP